MDELREVRALVLSVNHASESIKRIEKILIKNFGVNCAFVYRINDNEVLKFKERLLYKNFADDVKIKPLIECKLNVRLQVYPHLQAFLAAFYKHLEINNG